MRRLITGGGKHGVFGVAGAVGKIIAAHAVVVLEMSDNGFDDGPPFHFAFYLWRDTALLAGGEGAELVL